VTAEIVSVGTELLMGQIVNTNAQYLSKELCALGIDVYYQTTVGDNPARMKQTVSQALARADILMVTGGLGPTADDITKEIVAQAMELPMEKDEASAQRIDAFFSGIKEKATQNNYRQAYFPKGSLILPNERGTAPGCIVEQGGKRVIILPGPPREMTYMFEQSVAPYLRQLADKRIYSRVLRLFGYGESKLDDRLKDMIAAQTNPTIAPYAGLGEVTLRISAKSYTVQEADALIMPVLEEIRARVGDAIYSDDGVPMHEVVARLLVGQKKRFAVAESCTGGLVVSSLVAHPGISASLVEGIVCYSNGSKIKRLGVSRDTLEEFGAVSEQTAVEMAQGLLKQGVDIAVSTTGVAGPNGGTQQKPVGLVYVGIATKDGAYAREFRLHGDRARIRSIACLHALNQLRLRLLQ
jgi:nicotinamide-nucleotide amidase